MVLVGNELERRPTWPFAAVAGMIGLALAASSTPSPLYAVYQSMWGFSSVQLTAVYGIYAICVLVALVLAGGVSDFIGRRPTILAGLFGIVAMPILFILADGIALLYVGRTIQGLSTGLLLGAASAALIDLEPHHNGARAGLVNGIAAGVGIGLGAGISGLLVEYLPNPLIVPFAALAVVVIVAIFIAWRLPEPVADRQRLRLKPRYPRVPGNLRRIFALASLGVLSTWSVAGLQLSLGPSIISELADSSALALGGFFVFSTSVIGAIAQWTLRGLPDRLNLAGGSALLATSSLLSVVALDHGSLPGFLVASIAFGFGFGIAFLGALRMVSSRAPVDNRAAVMSALLVVAYFSISIPAVLAGIAVGSFGLVPVFHWFGIAVAALAAVVAVVGWIELRPETGKPVG